jgi:hypothetical protein
MLGIEPKAWLGKSVSYVGDVNNDGIGDFLIGMPGASLNNSVNAGLALLVYGSTAFTSVLDLWSFSVKTGRIIVGFAANTFLGATVSNGGDINKDMRSDLLVGAPNWGGGYGLFCAIFDVVGNSSSIFFDIHSRNGTNGVCATGRSNMARLASSLASGDIDADTFSDVLAGSFRYLYLVHGRKNFNSTVDLETDKSVSVIDFEEDVILLIASGHDVNGGGVVDIIAATSTRIFVISGDRTRLPSRVSINFIDPRRIIRVINIPEGQVLHSVGLTGDTNGNGAGEIIIGLEGECVLIHGINELIEEPPPKEPLELSALTMPIGYKVITDGQCIANSIGDFNGDSLADTMYTAPTALNGMGQGWVSLSPGPSSSPLNKTALNGTNGFPLDAVTPGGALGAAFIQSAGSVDGDKLSDILLSAPNATVGDLSQAGAFYLLGGQRNIQPQIIQTIQANTTSGSDINVITIVIPVAAALIGGLIGGVISILTKWWLKARFAAAALPVAEAISIDEISAYPKWSVDYIDLIGHNSTFYTEGNT